MAPPIEFSGVTVVAVGALNPAIFQPQWFLDKELIAENAATSAQDRLLVSPELTVFTADWLSVQITLQQAVFATVDEGREFDLRDLFKGVFSLLPETPIDAVGINADAHFRLDTESAWHEIGDRFLPKELWEPVFDDGGFRRRADGKAVGLRSLTVEVTREDGRGFVRVEVAPSARVTPNGVFAGINAHFQLSTQDRRANGYEATRTVDENWEKTRKLEARIIDNFLAIA
jgi:hypothetical protein